MAKTVIPEKIIYHCDKCKKEITTKFLSKIEFTSYGEGFDRFPKEFCDSCFTKIMDFALSPA